jgi:hypothetical protein
MSYRLLVSILAAGVALGVAPSFAQQNGSGPDPDGDTNPATNTRAMARIGDPADAALDPPFRTITFETTRNANGEKISNQYAKDYGVAFGAGLRRQVCEGQRYFQYDTLCTYLAPPSGNFAALYRDDWKRPLRVTFDKPVCAAALAVYPTGGREGEKFQVTLQPWKDDKTKLTPATITLSWTQDTFRWRTMVGAFFLNAPAARVDVSVVSLDHKSDIVQFLVDDVSFVESGCDALLAEIDDAADFKTGGAAIEVKAPARN